MVKKTCKRCLKDKEYIDTGRQRRKDRVYTEHIDESGQYWRYHICPDCVKLKQTLRDRKAGRYKPIDESEVHCIKVGRTSEKIAAEFFESQGFIVHRNDKVRGPDLIIENNEFKKTVEVKTVSVSTSGSSLYVSKVRSKRKLDDLIAYVKEREVRVVPMKEHLENCTKNGKRIITKLWKL